MLDYSDEMKSFAEEHNQRVYADKLQMKKDVIALPFYEKLKIVSKMQERLKFFGKTDIEPWNIES